MYADSLSINGPNNYVSAPKRIVKPIQWWLTALLPGAPFSEVSCDFEVPEQLDANSCGVIVLSIMASALLGYSQWTQAVAEVFRMQWFLRLSGVYGQVRYLHSHIHTNLTPILQQEVPAEECDLHDPDIKLMDVDSDAANSGIIDVDLDWDKVSIPACADSPSTSSSWTDFSSLDAPPWDSGLKQQPSVQKMLLSPPPQMKLSFDSHLSDSDCDSDLPTPPHQRPHSIHGPQAGSSWEAHKWLKQEAKNPDFLPKQSNLATFHQKVLDMVRVSTSALVGDPDLYPRVYRLSKLKLRSV